MIYFYKSNFNNEVTIYDFPDECQKYMADSGFLSCIKRFDKLFSFNRYYKMRVIVTEYFSFNEKEYKYDVYINKYHLGTFREDILDLNELHEMYDFFEALIRVVKNIKNLQQY